MGIARRWLVAGALALAAGASGCASGVQAPPAESLTSTRTPGRFVWHDLVTKDLAAAKKFYGGLLGWTFEEVKGTKGRYVFIRHDGRVIGGMAEVKSGTNSSQWLSHVSTPNVDAVAKATAASGGRVAIAPFSLEKGRARLAVLVDPEGAPFGAVTLTPGDPAVRDAAENEWLWHELWTADKPKATAFYAGLFGYQPGTKTFPAGNYEVLTYGAELRAGLQQLPNANVRPNWLPYIRVGSAKALAARAKELGGTVLVAPQEQLRAGSVALVQDPTGAAVALQEWPVKSMGGR